jgi:hypothetical protein
MPRQMRRLAMRSVLSDKAAIGGLLIVDTFDSLEGRTKAMLTVLDALKLQGRKVLIMVPNHVDNLTRAAGNIPGVILQLAQYLSLVDMLKADVVVMPRASLEVIDGILGSTGGRRPRPVLLPEGMAVAADMPAALDMGVQQMEGASTVTADHVTTRHASRGVEEAIEEAAEEHNTSDDAPTEGQG